MSEGLVLQLGLICTNALPNQLALVVFAHLVGFRDQRQAISF